MKLDDERVKTYSVRASGEKKRSLAVKKVGGNREEVNDGFLQFLEAACVFEASLNVADKHANLAC